MNAPRSRPGPAPGKDDSVPLEPHSSPPQPEQPEPLLALLTSQHPFLETAINGSLSAYSCSKQYSPRFKQGAEFVERHIGSSVVSTVGTAGRISGVENGVRWWLKRGNAIVLDGSNKRRRNEAKGATIPDVERGLRESSVHHNMQRRFSEMSIGEELPAYDDKRAPSYEEYQMAEAEHQENTNRNWQTRFMMSTSGLGVAMSEESLHSLKYCLNGVRWANKQLAQIIASLQRVIARWGREEESNSSEHNNADDQNSQCQSPNSQTTKPRESDKATILQHVQCLKADVMRIIKQIVGIISKYAGGGLPENARKLVHQHLTSIPHRFRLATLTNAYQRRHGEQSEESEAISSAKMVVVLAQEGLDMMAQVSGVLDGTIVSAEEWCDRLGRRRAAPAPTGENQKPENISVRRVGQNLSIGSVCDLKMAGMDEKVEDLALRQPKAEEIQIKQEKK